MSDTPTVHVDVDLSPGEYILDVDNGTWIVYEHAKHVHGLLADPTTSRTDAERAVIDAAIAWRRIGVDPEFPGEQFVAEDELAAAVDRLAATGEKPCPSCNGRGSWWPEDAERSDLKAHCQVCKGSGRLVAPGPKEATSTRFWALGKPVSSAPSSIAAPDNRTGQT